MTPVGLRAREGNGQTSLLEEANPSPSAHFLLDFLSFFQSSIYLANMKSPEELCDNSIHVTTAKTYRSGLNRWTAFRLQHGKPSLLHEENKLDQLRRFVAFCFNAGCKGGTCAVYMNAVAHLHQKFGIDIPHNHTSVQR